MSLSHVHQKLAKFSACRLKIQAVSLLDSHFKRGIFDTLVGACVGRGNSTPMCAIVTCRLFGGFKENSINMVALQRNIAMLKLYS